MSEVQQHKPIEKTRVLLVEDTARLREALLDGIRQAGFSGEGVATAEQALSLMQEEPYDILLLDLHLPGMSGMECFAEVRQQWPQAEVIILTGYGDLDAARQAIHLDAVEFLTKPASLGEIEKALDKAWRRLCVKGPTIERAVEVDEGVNGAPVRLSLGILQRVERGQILETLDRHHGNREAAAAELGISVRTLYYRLASYRD